MLHRCRLPSACSLGLGSRCSAPATVGRKKGAASGFFGGCTGLLRALRASRCTRLCHCTATKDSISCTNPANMYVQGGYNVQCIHEIQQLLHVRKLGYDGDGGKALAWVRGSSDSVTRLGASGAGAPASPRFS